jgi:CheY-like chemotaxis protein
VRRSPAIFRTIQQGYEVVTAVDGEDGLRRARELEPDLVLLDVMMPKLDGISVLKELKGDTALRFIPVILVTAKADKIRARVSSPFRLSSPSSIPGMRTGTESTIARTRWAGISPSTPPKRYRHP